MHPLVRTLVTHWDQAPTLPWDALVRQHGEALTPFAGLAPAGVVPAQRQVQVEALGHLGTVQQLAGWELPFLLVKGIAWGAHLWGDPLRRPARDVDVVIRPADLTTWQHRLQTAGFHAERSPLEWVQGRQIVQLHHTGPSSHWLHHVAPPWDAFWQRSRLTNVGDVPVRQPDDADILLYLAHHQVFRHGLAHDLGWLDLAAWLRLPQAPQAVAVAWSRAAGTHLAGSLVMLAWAWRSWLGQTGLEGIPRPPSRLLKGLGTYLRRYPGNPLGQSALSVLLAQGDERRRLLAGLRQGFGAWWRWRSGAGDGH